MGQESSIHAEIVDFFAPILDIADDEPVTTLLAGELHKMTYDQFLDLLLELNKISKNILDSTGKHLVFAVKKGTDSTAFWKATVQIACVKYNPATKKVDTYRLLDMRELLKVSKTLKCQMSAVEQSKSDPHQDEITRECCICLERKQEVTLPCAHSFCTACIEQWNESSHTCPICREQLQSTDDTWVLFEEPNAEEISNEIRNSLIKLSEQSCSPSCLPS